MQIQNFLKIIEHRFNNTGKRQITFAILVKGILKAYSIILLRAAQLFQRTFFPKYMSVCECNLRLLWHLLRVIGQVSTWQWGVFNRLYLYSCQLSSWSLSPSHGLLTSIRRRKWELGFSCWRSLPVLDISHLDLQLPGRPLLCLLLGLISFSSLYHWQYVSSIHVVSSVRSS